MGEGLDTVLVRSGILLLLDDLLLVNELTQLALLGVVSSVFGITEAPLPPLLEYLDELVLDLVDLDTVLGHLLVHLLKAVVEEVEILWLQVRLEVLLFFHLLLHGLLSLLLSLLLLELLQLLQVGLLLLLLHLVDQVLNDIIKSLLVPVLLRLKPADHHCIFENDRQLPPLLLLLVVVDHLFRLLVLPVVLLRGRVADDVVDSWLPPVVLNEVALVGVNRIIEFLVHSPDLLQRVQSHVVQA